MIFQRHFRCAVRAGLFDHASRIVGRGFNAVFSQSKNYDPLPRFPSQMPQNCSTLSGSLQCLKGETLGTKLNFTKPNENGSPPFAMTSRSSIHLDTPKEADTGRNYNRPMGFVRGVMDQNENMGNFPLSRYSVEQNADVVHIKMMRNNTFVTISDSKGNKKAGASSGCLSEMKGGPKASRYAAEATSEHVGRLARNMGLKSVVMKVNGFTYFKKKKMAILSFREGYTHSRGDQNPIVYIEDTTRKPHNGCRLRKKRRV